ncbi:MAG: toprim domain-containing protein [Phocaeicola plebeius]|uniref:toprim domain-containing protein n=1 Tax=Phocaeicola plebeius TaxID=310297 RepID=UPI0026EF496C|nr:toprim domain-containing protein [Phocaeicola plebeius]MCI6051075.1 toprim domain-containing protein [Phocaeicola plebeius]MCI7347552.1 toprim domain-containing protein [Bacteroides stercoris]MDY3105168.1 toprim domain-containing protein [Prevotella sp.]
MTIQDAKQIKLADYLQSLGYTPIKQQGKSLWYKSPLRNETDASFKVNTELNQWYDFGIGKGGNIIALAAELYHSENVAYLLERIAERTPYIRPASFSFGEQKAHNSSFQGVQVGELSSPALIDYLRGRGINIELAKRECKELRFENKGKPYFAIGFPNITGGYELRNRYFKGCLAPKDITHIRHDGEQRAVCYLFEGFMDYLSFLTIRVNNNPEKPRTDEQDYIVLNSVTNLSKAEQLLRPYSRIGCFLDNDQAGQRAYENLRELFGDRLRDMCKHYAGHKDLNDYLCHINQTKQAEKQSQVQSARRIPLTKPKRKQGFGL